MKNSISNREAFSALLIKAAKTDRDIVVLTSDSRGSAGLTAFGEVYPNRHIEVGIAEQNIIGIAAGLAASGMKPIVASPACFMSMRGAEQIKVDIAYSNNPVLLLGISGGVSYGALGMTHHSLQDIALMRAIPNMSAFLPADRFETAAILSDWLNNPRPAYMRIGRNAVEDVYEDEDIGYIPNKSSIVYSGNDAAIITAGETVRIALDAAIQLKNDGIGVSVISMHTIKPLDTEVIIETAKRVKFILTVEEHSIFGGLGGAVCETVSQNAVIKVKILGIPDEPAVSGTASQIFSHYGLTSENIANIIRAEAVR